MLVESHLLQPSKFCSLNGNAGICQEAFIAISKITVIASLQFQQCIGDRFGKLIGLYIH